jgi:hypothetical protein
MLSRAPSFFASAVAVALVTACGGATDTGSNRGILTADAGTGGSSGASSNGGATSGSGGAKQGTGGTPSGGGASSTGGVAGAGQGGRAAGGTSSGGTSGAGAGGASGASTGGANAGGASAEGGVCNLCLLTYDLHWGQNGGFVAYVETSRLGPCAAYSHERTPTTTDPPSLICNDHISACPGSSLDGIITAMSAPAFQTAMQNHTLYGNDPRPVDGQVFRIGIGNDFIDIGPNCESDPTACPTMPEPVANMAKLLRDLDATELAKDPCKSVFP